MKHLLLNDRPLTGADVVAVPCRILGVAAEYAPLVKAGGLADVTAALPRYLRAEGCEIRTLLPCYPALREISADWPEVRVFPDFFGGRAAIRMGLWKGEMLLLLDAPHLFDRAGSPYGADGKDFPDNARRFAALSVMAAILAAQGLPDHWRPAVLHAHDWHCALAPWLLRRRGAKVGSVLTIHNAAFQGVFPASVAADLGCEVPVPDPDLEHYGQLCFLKAGLLSADEVTTVSPHYARELTLPETGMAMDVALRSRGERFRGILNGVERTPPSQYRRKLAAKCARRAALLSEFGLSGSGPLAVVVSRLTEQKGLDLIIAAEAALTEGDFSLILVGAGDPAIENGLRALQERLPGRVGLHLQFCTRLAQRLFEGGDCILIPSRFEPCGLTQMQAMAEGTIPVGTAVGGLSDTIIDATPAALRAGVATGFLFPSPTEANFTHALGRVRQLYDQQAQWLKMQRNAMRMDFGWSEAAAEYASVYRSAARMAVREL